VYLISAGLCKTHSLSFFYLDTKEAKDQGRKDIQPLPAMQLCGTDVLLWFVQLIFIVRLCCRQFLSLGAVGLFILRELLGSHGGNL
jgi:hypothetical protein